MLKRIGWVKWLLGVLLAALLLGRAQAAANGAQRALWQWYSAVAPSMFPFLALMPLLTGPDSAAVYERLLGPAMREILRLPGGAAPALGVGLIAGSPAGALAARRAAAQSGMNRGQVRRLALGVAGLSPGFLVGGIGAGMLGSAALGWRLAAVQWLSQTMLLIALRGAWRDYVEPVPGRDAEDAPPLRAAVLAALGVAGWMALFGALTGAASALVGERAGRAVLCLLDLPSGAALLAQSTLGEAEKLTLLSALTGFGGVCIGLQNLAALRDCGIRPREYWAVRAAAAGISAGLMRASLLLERGAALRAAPGALPAACLAASMLALPMALRRARRVS